MAVDGSDFSVIAGYLDTSSAGAFILLEDKNNVSGLDSFRNLSIGALGNVIWESVEPRNCFPAGLRTGLVPGGGGGTLTVN